MSNYNYVSKKAKKAKQENLKLLSAWNKLEQALNDTEQFDKSSVSTTHTVQHKSKQNINLTSFTHKPFIQNSRPQTAKGGKIRPLSGVGYKTYGNKNRPISAISQVSKGSSNFMNQTQMDNFMFDINENSQLPSLNKQQNQNLPVSKVSTMKSLMNLRAQSRPYKRPGTAKANENEEDLKILSQIPHQEMENLIQKSEIIHSLQVDQILDLYTAKCLDTKVEYKPEQAVKFIEKIKKSCKKRVFSLCEQQLNLESANVLAHIFQSNNYFSKLELERNGLSNGGVALIGEALKYNNTLIHLNLASNDIGTQGFIALLEALMENESIVSLDVSSREGLYRNRITEECSLAMEQYLRYSNILMFLNISSTSLSLEGINQILEGAKNNHTLLKLDISGNKLGGELGDILVSQLHSTKIQELNLSNTEIGDMGVQRLSDMFGNMSKYYRIQNLDLSNNSIGANSISRLFSALCKNQYIEKLNLDGNFFNSKAFQNVTNMLWENTSLRVLSMQNCDIEKEGGEYIGYGLSKNCGIQELYLHGNKLRDYGCKILGEGLKENRNVRILDISSCKIGDEGGISIANYIMCGENSLKNLNLKDNKITDYAGVMLCESLRVNKNITKINIERNAISYKHSEDAYHSVQMNINHIKSNQVPAYLNIMHDLKAYERQKYDVQEQKIELDDRKQMAQQDLEEFKNYVEQEKEKEIKDTSVIDKEQEQVKYELNQAIQEESECLRFIAEERDNMDFAEKKLQNDIGEANADMQRLKSEIEKHRQSQVKKIKEDRYRYHQQMLEDIAFKERQTMRSLETYLKQMKKFKEDIVRYESGYDSEEEREKQRAAEEEKLKQQELEKQKQQQQKKTGKKKKSLAGKKQSVANNLRKK